MSEPARTAVDIRDFRGMASNVDPNDFQPGFSEVQINVNGFKRGELQVRRGLREIEFEGEQ